MKQRVEDWLAENNYDDNQYVIRNSNSPFGVNTEGVPLEEVLIQFAKAFNLRIEEIDNL